MDHALLDVFYILKYQYLTYVIVTNNITVEILVQGFNLMLKKVFLFRVYWKTIFVFFHQHQPQ